MEESNKDKFGATAIDSSVDSVESPNNGSLVNVSGHKQELERNFGLISLCGLSITSGNTWIALGGSVVRIAERI